MQKSNDEIKRMVREGYARVAKNNTSCCSSGGCCGSAPSAEEISRIVGYGDDDLRAVPDGANLGLGCGNPVALALLKPGDVVLDLGSGAGFDAFIAARKIGKTGRVIGVDMTREMLEKARDNARKGGFVNVEFREGEIENMPVDDDSVDVVISNCVINLSTDKKAVFNEAYRVLKSGGRLMVSDLVLVKDLPQDVKESVEAYVGCLAGAIEKNEYLRFVEQAGFQDIRVMGESGYPVDAMFDGLEAARDAIASIKVSAIKK
jgi:arsenite methyltransferase